MNSRLTIFVDHGEAYGNLGDEAMLLNAVARLQYYLAPCKVLLTSEETCPLPIGLAKIEMVSSPRVMLGTRAIWVEHQFNKLYRLPSVWRWLPKPSEIFFWKTAAWLSNVEGWLWYWRLWGRDSANSKWREHVHQCDLFYGVGAATLNEPNMYGLVYKAWVYREVRRLIGFRVLSAQGVGPFSTRAGVSRLRSCFRSMSLVSFRDYDYSMTLARRLGLCRVELAITGDEAFSLPVASDHVISEYLKSAGLGKEEPYIAVHFRATDYTRETLSLLPLIADLLDRLSGRSPRMLFIPMSYDTHSGRDEEYGMKIRATLQNPSRFLVAPLCKDVQVIKGVVGKARFSLGLSYHLHVFSLSQGHPAVILYTGEYYKLKSDGLIGFYGSPNVAINLETAKTDEVENSLRLVEADYETACKEIRQVNEGLHEKNDWILRETAKHFGRTSRHGKREDFTTDLH